MTLPLTFSVEPSVIRAPSEAELVVRVAVAVALPPPVAVVRPSDLSRSALPVTDTSAPAELFSVTMPAVIDDGVAAEAAPMVAAPLVIVEVCTPLARSIAVSTSLTVAAGVPAVPR
ncbi:hypothetical protein ACVIIV_004012 [Bradyrhizobium sp. USDA 4354]